MTGQYECGKVSSLIWKLSLICSAALVIIVPLIWTKKVMKHARSVTRHFLDIGQLKGFSGSVGPSQSMSWVSDFGSWSSVGVDGIDGCDGLVEVSSWPDGVKVPDDLELSSGVDMVNTVTAPTTR